MTQAPSNTAAESILRHDRRIAMLGLCILTFIAWIHLITGAGTGMSIWSMTTMSFPPPQHASMPMGWTTSYGALMLSMWWIMMIAMMTPSAAPMVLLFGRVSRHAQRKGRMNAGPIPTPYFLSGYLIAWLGFSLAATILQWSMERAGLVHGMLMWSVSQPLSAGLLIAAGLYQLSPLKHVCLEHCRSPAEFLSKRWRSGPAGAFRMGAEHGAYCLGCCWILMALLFVGGAMNLVWIAGLSIVVLIEKIAPFGHRIANAFGAAMLVLGVWVLYS